MIGNFALLVVEMVLLNVLLLTLHRLSPRYGVLPVVATAATLVGILRFASAVSVYVQLAPGLRFTVAGNVLIPTILLIVLVLYVVEGTIPARLTIGVILGMEALSYLLYNAMGWHLNLPGGGSFANLEANDPLITPTLRTTLASAVAFLIDLYVIAFLFQALVNYAPRLPLWLKSGITLTGVMALNVTIFWLLAAESVEEFTGFLPGNLVGALIAGLVLTPVLAIYLGRGVTHLPEYRGLERRPTFALLFGTFGQIERRLEHSESALHDATRRYLNDVDRERMRSERLREFVNEMVHDMKSPLSGINLRINLVHRSYEPDQRQKHLDAIRNQVEQLTGMIDVVFEIARLEREPTSKKEVMDLCDFLRRVFDPCKVIGEAKLLKMEITGCDTPILVRLDEMTLRRALTNLLENAIRYTERGAVMVRVERRGERAVIDVQDTGIGIDPEELPNIFDRYFRSRAARQDEAAQGLGLGLAIVKRVVEQHDGVMSVDSAKGVGTTFRITLPIAE